jgi:hypothetical protein
MAHGLSAKTPAITAKVLDEHMAIIKEVLSRAEELSRL